MPFSVLLYNGPGDLYNGAREAGDHPISLLEFLVDSLSQLEPPSDSFVKADVDGLVDHVPECFE
jgi:hypothetical protein